MKEFSKKLGDVLFATAVTLIAISFLLLISCLFLLFLSDKIMETVLCITIGTTLGFAVCIIGAKILNPDEYVAKKSNKGDGSDATTILAANQINTNTINDNSFSSF